MDTIPRIKEIASPVNMASNPEMSERIAINIIPFGLLTFLVNMNK
jgi:hypothetical protein